MAYIRTSCHILWLMIELAHKGTKKPRAESRYKVTKWQGGSDRLLVNGGSFKTLNNQKSGLLGKSSRKQLLQL